MHDQLNSPFFAVPGEIREGIYGFYLAFQDEDFHFSRLPSNAFLSKEPYSRPLPALMISCKRTYREMQAAVHEEAVLRAYRTGDRKRLGFAVHGTLRIPRLRKMVFQVVMEGVNWGWWLRFFGSVMETAQELRELVVSWKLRKSHGPWNGGQSVSPSKQFMARLEEKAEARFVEAIVLGSSNATSKLQTVTVHGDVPAHWCEQLQKALGGRTRVVVVVKADAWDADGLGTVSSRRWNGGRAEGRSWEPRMGESRLTPM